MPILWPSSTTGELGVELKSTRQSMAGCGTALGSADEGEGLVAGDWVEPGKAASADVPDRETNGATEAGDGFERFENKRSADIRTIPVKPKPIAAAAPFHPVHRKRSVDHAANVHGDAGRARRDAPCALSTGKIDPLTVDLPLRVNCDIRSIDRRACSVAKGASAMDRSATLENRFVRSFSRHF